MLDRLLCKMPGTRAHARHAAITRRANALGQALREPLTGKATMDLAAARIVRRTTEVSAREPSAQPPTHPVCLDTAAAEWADVLRAHDFLPLARDQLRRILLGMARQLAGSHAEVLPRTASRVGRDLGQRLRVTPQAFEGLLESLIPWIERCHPDRDPAGFPIRTNTIAALAGGFAVGIRERVFDEQIALSDTIRATHQVERARALDSPLVFQAKLAASNRPMALLDRHGRILAINDAARELLALHAEDQDVLLEDCAYTDADCATIRTLLDDVLDAGTAHPEFAVAWPEGTFKAWVAATMCWHQGSDANPGRICAVFADATRHYVWRRHLDYLANRDDVTDLPSRRDLLGRVRAALDGPADRVGICAIRMVGLTRIERELGPRHADTMITTLAARVTGAVAGTPGATIARLSRDTFAVLLTGEASWAGVGDMVNRLATWLGAPVRSDRHNLTVAPRIGVVEASLGTVTADDLLNQAEAALDTEITTTRPWTVVEDIREHVRAGQIARLPGAVANNELTLAYSPITGVQTGAIVGLQVHTYWHHREHGDLLIDDLVELADSLGLTLPVCRWTLDHATGHAAVWRKMFRTSAPFILLTVPRRLAGEDTLVDHVRGALAATGLPPQLLCLALPGAAMLDEQARVRPHLAALDSMGVPLLLDGFGTTFSHYHRLPELPLHGVVLPAELTGHLRDATHRRKPRALTHALIALAADLGLTTLLRGLTTPDQLHDARLTTAELAQGDLIGRPLPADDIDALLYDRPANLPHNWAHHPPWTR